VAVIGAGQAGLSAAYHLRRQGLEYVVLDGNRAGRAGRAAATAVSKLLRAA
jgi:cation diffusion facilitator CzcD-associated flavoprotein CzcO